MRTYIDTCEYCGFTGELFGWKECEQCHRSFRDKVDVANTDFEQRMGYVYFAKQKDADLVKIGTTTRIILRKRQIQTTYGVKVKYIGFDYGGFEKEADVHQLFAHLRISRKEWFKYTPEIDQYIAQHGYSTLEDIDKFLRLEWEKVAESLSKEIPSHYYLQLPELFRHIHWDYKSDVLNAREQRRDKIATLRFNKWNAIVNPILSIQKLWVVADENPLALDVLMKIQDGLSNDEWQRVAELLGVA